MRTLRGLIAASLLLFGAAGPGRGQETPASTPVPQRLSRVLQQAQEDLREGRIAEAARRLREYDGSEDHALRHLVLGNALYRMDDLAGAAAAYRKALDLDKGMHAARRALARIHAQQGDWTAAVKMLGTVVSPGSADADWLALYAQAGLETGDERLGRVLVDAGITRFPGDARFRKLDVTLLIREGDLRRARGALLHLLESKPGSAELWRRLAALYTGEEELTRQTAVLEAALLCDPSNLEGQRQYLTALLLAGDWLTAVGHGESLLAGSERARVVKETALIELLVRAADSGGRGDKVRTWTGLVPEKRRTRVMRIAEARTALREGKVSAARDVLGRLIAMGESDAAVFLWAGRLAEDEGAILDAEAYYEQARKQGDASAGMADLHLARLYLGAGRPAESENALRRYLAMHPEDPYARALLQIVKTRLAESAR